MYNINYYKQMRILLIYDLPTVDDEDRKIYQKFHNNLHKLGFYMLQYSVYTKVVSNDTVYNQYLNRLNFILPNKGNIIILKITEKQYQNMIYLRGIKNKYDAIVGGNELVIFRGDSNE